MVTHITTPIARVYLKMRGWEPVNPEAFSNGTDWRKGTMVKSLIDALQYEWAEDKKVEVLCPGQ
jgi:hypothetical protein